MRKLALILTLPAAGCASAPPAAPMTDFCGRLRAPWQAHVDTLLASPDDRSVMTGVRLLAQIEAGCDWSAP